MKENGSQVLGKTYGDSLFHKLLAEYQKETVRRSFLGITMVPQEQAQLFQYSEARDETTDEFLKTVSMGIVATER